MLHMTCDTHHITHITCDMLRGNAREQLETVDLRALPYLTLTLTLRPSLGEGEATWNQISLVK